MPPVPLRRNRDFVLLQIGQLLSDAGSQTTSIAYPLLVLAVTHSPAEAGAVGFARIVPFALFALPAGAVADRRNRKWLMIAADAVRLVALAALAATILAGAVRFWAILGIAFVEGVATVFFSAAQSGALRSVVPTPQMPTASATVTGRRSVVILAGPPLGGALFGIARAIPFLVDAGSYAFSTLSLLAMRTPFQERREPDSAPLRAQIAEGFGYLWNHAFLRTCALLFGIGNFVFPGLALTIVVVGRRHGLTSSEIGGLTAAFGGTLLLGSLLSGYSRRFFSVRTILLLELWTWTGCALFLVWPSVYVLTVSILPTALTIPSTDSVVHGFRIGMTPDRLIGRVESAARNISLLAAPVGPLLAGFLLDSVSERETVAVFAGCGLVLALWGTTSRAIKDAPSLAALEDVPREPPLDLDPTMG
jgi:MFS family permease